MKECDMMAPKLSVLEKIKMIEQNNKKSQKSLKNVEFVAQQTIFDISIAKDRIHQIQSSGKYSLQNCEL